ncbi:LytTR family DNA-binding domain-containing protein [Yeosuana sp. MJ-SS3]|uniref:LytTR family DNA-binding domain-containing protein n=1 Tax=Gilvirhabdus luticola TaxID=3079858 RepID=A0ABU3U6C9_9FLAO|nr:LytTR family DNA-binding domain-containing protein [Yeosuana sp. MJ-SS3]MDU8885961.1 LytTR family DNA-binding domain-containing protein [Yeosuana sp. MJ-SS3]
MGRFKDSFINLKRTIVIILIVLCVAITFESFQQVYYINRYQLAEDVTFFGVVKYQALRWLVWLMLSYVLYRYAKSNASKANLSTLDILKYILLIASLVLLGIIIISILQFLVSDTTFNLNLLFGVFIPFFTFQKAPIYTLGYIAVAIILNLHFANIKLQIDVLELAELKKTNQNLYNKFSATNDDKTNILNIKIGNNHKIILVNDISWIEADDYCVKVHTANLKVYTMRSSLKSLEEKLNGNFLRVHRKAIVNMNVAKELKLSQPPCLILKNNEEIPVSKSNLKVVKDFISK